MLVPAVLIGLLVGLGVFAVNHVEGPSYLSNDHNACANCHIMRDRLAGWQTGPYKDAAICNACHDLATMDLCVTRPGFINDGIAKLAASDEALNHLPSITRWRESSRDASYNPNEEASRQEMRVTVWGQRHIEHYEDDENARHRSL
jgi:formate-dependent nitrite reductase cytochrome c552 subunit